MSLPVSLLFVVVMSLPLSLLFVAVMSLPVSLLCVAVVVVYLETDQNRVRVGQC